MDILHDPILGENELWRILVLAGIILIGFVGGKILKFSFNRSAKKFEKKEWLIVASFMEELANSVTFILLVLAFIFGINVLVLSEGARGFFDTLCEILGALAVGYAVFNLINVPSRWFEIKTARTETKLDDMLVPLVRRSLKFTVVVLLFVQIVEILSDKPITSIIAGLGIGGLAIALAGQESIKNFFGSIMILADRPFDVGDRIVVDGFDGPVKEVGLRSTKIETLEGHLVTVPNGRLADMSIQNIGKRPFIRRIVNIGLPFDIEPAKIDQALKIIRDLLKDHKGFQDPFEPRVYLNDIKADQFNIIVIYWYHPPAYWDFLAFSEWFNKEVHRQFTEAGIPFGYPSQRIHLAGTKKAINQDPEN
ncbi:MAG: mechanosensitive ion channel family protein [Verrucomicrobiae bacterium]|nr:mechanosensitive ion channel family protein [Verrucomicrobiae bacterium]